MCKYIKRAKKIPRMDREMEKDHLPDKPGRKHEKTRPRPSTQPTSQKWLGATLPGDGRPRGSADPLSVPFAPSLHVATMHYSLKAVRGWIPQIFPQN